MSMTPHQQIVRPDVTAWRPLPELPPVKGGA